MADWDGDSSSPVSDDHKNHLIPDDRKNRMDTYLDRSRKSAEYHIAFESDKWMVEIPELQFPPNWKIRIIPPFGCAVIRFCVTDHNGSGVSVYLDCYRLCGATEEPYWEIYPGDNEQGEPSRFSMNDTAALLTGIENSLFNQNPAPYTPEKHVEVKASEETKDRFTTLDHELEES